MPEHYCKNCKKSNGNNTCSLTGALHTTGIECPSFGQKESKMFKIGDKVRVIADEAQLKKRCVSDLTLIGKVGVVIDVRERSKSGKIYGVRVDDGVKWEYYDQDLELVEEEVKESKMFKIGDKVTVIADEKRLASIGLSNMKVLGAEGTVIRNTLSGNIPIKMTFDKLDGEWGLAEQDLELIEEEVKEGWVATADAELAAGCAPSTRTFDSGATRDTDQGKLDYLKALSPIVLRRYVQYLDKHRKQSDGSYRDFDNWKKGIPEEAYISGSGRHFIDTWLLTEGYATEDNHGPVEIEDAICAQLFNLMGRLHEMLGKKVDRAAPLLGVGGH